MLETFDMVVHRGDVANLADRGLTNAAIEENQACAPTFGHPVRFLETLER